MISLHLVCPSCATGIVLMDEAMFDDGDPLVCIVCRALTVYVAAAVEREVTMEGLGTGRTVSTPASLRRPTEVEEDTMLRSSHVQKMIGAVGQFHARHGSPSPQINPPDQGPSAGGRPPY